MTWHALSGGPYGGELEGWHWSHVHLLGFSDGGTVALEVAARCTGEGRLGGAAVVCAGLLPETLAGRRVPAAGAGAGAGALASLPPNTSAPTPVVLTCGALDTVVGTEA